MATTRDRIAFLLWVLIVIPGFTSLSSAKDSGPAVGSVAPEIGPCQWLQKEKDRSTKIAELRGMVVLIHTFAVGCFP